MADTLTDWLVREMPAGTIIGDPRWWAKRIARVARNNPAPEAPPLALTGEERQSVGALADWVRDGHVCDTFDPCGTCRHVAVTDALLARTAAATATTVRECNYWRPIPPGGIALPCNCGMGCDGPTAAATATSREDAALLRIAAAYLTPLEFRYRDGDRTIGGVTVTDAILARARALAGDADARGTA